MASPEDMAELETAEEEEVLRRLGTREKAGLTGEEAARRLRIHGPNVVSGSHHVATHKAIYGGLDFARSNGVGWVMAGLIWLYNFAVLMTPAFVYHRCGRANMNSDKMLAVCMLSAILRLILIWSLYVILDVRLQQPVST